VARRRAARRCGDAVAQSVVGGRHPGGREQSVRLIPCVGVHAVVREVPSCVVSIAGIGDLVGEAESSSHGLYELLTDVYRN